MQNPLSANKIERGAVALVPFPNSDLQTAKLRPALIVQADDLDTKLNQIVLAMISSNLARANHKSRVLIETKTENGKESGLKTMSEVDDALRHTLNL